MDSNSTLNPSRFMLHIPTVLTSNAVVQVSLLFCMALWFLLRGVLCLTLLLVLVCL